MRSLRITAALLVLAMPGHAWAGLELPTVEPPLPSCGFLCQLGGDFREFGTSRDTATLLVVGLGLSLASRGADARVAESRINSQLHPDTVLDRLLEPGELGGSTPVQLGIAATTYLAGALGRSDRTRSLGSALVRAQIVNGIATTGLKVSVRRERPDGGDRRSFPSGHTSGAFATATVLQRELGWKAGVPAFAFASLVGASRLSENRHHLSDVVFGAALGLAAGLSVDLGRQRVLRLEPQAAPGRLGLQLVVRLR